MRTLKRQTQSIYFVDAKIVKVGIDNVLQYGVPVEKKMCVSATGGKTLKIDIGLEPKYERYITSYERDFKPKEGSYVFIDIDPILDEDGLLMLKDDGVTPMTTPDYYIDKIIDTKVGYLARYGLVKVGDANGY